MIFSADFVRNVQTHYFWESTRTILATLDTSTRTLRNERFAATLAACGVASIDQAIQGCPGLYPGGDDVSVADFASLGLTSSADFGHSFWVQLRVHGPS